VHSNSAKGILVSLIHQQAQFSSAENMEMGGAQKLPLAEIILFFNGILFLLYIQLHTPTNLLLLSLAVADFFVGLLMFFQIVLIDGCWFLGDLMCTLYQYLAFIITSASIGTMVIISIDRYIAICYPLHYSTKVTQERIKVCICLCWTCSFNSILFI
uniref:G-protein coupled receptors family 1 profile domain-containing protein n=1 Tax=Amphilophus citrinellus TaxID=61819 RepID=A0A3Q0R9I4_AMPCI